MKTVCFLKASLRGENNAALSRLKCTTKPILGHIFCFSKAASTLVLGRKNLKTQLCFYAQARPSTLIRHENEAFRKHSFTWRNLKTPVFRFRSAYSRYCYMGNIFKTELLENSGLTKLFSNTNQKCPVIVESKFLRRRVEEKKNRMFSE